jgi:hypothetical protein
MPTEPALTEWSTMCLPELVRFLEDWVDDRVERDGQFVIVSVNGERYLQFAVGEDGGYAECVSNDNMALAEWLSQRDEALLFELGWKRPNQTSERNFWREWPTVAPTEDIVRDLTQALTCVYMRPTDDTVEVLADAFGSTE